MLAIRFRVLWSGFIALNLAQTLISLKQIPMARERVSDAERLRRVAKAKFADYKIEPEIAEQLHLEVSLAQLGRLELGVKNGEDGPTDDELWRDIVRPLKAKRDPRNFGHSGLYRGLARQIGCLS